VLTGALEAFVADYSRKKWTEEGRKIKVPTCKNKRVAIVGAGPAGLGCADILSVCGYQVTVFDGKPAPGGLLVFGIPNFKLPKDVVNSIIQDLKDMGITFIGNTVIGKDKSVDDLLEEGFEAVFIGVGAGVDATMGIPGEDLPGVYKGSDFLILANTNPDVLPEGMEKDFKISRKVIVVGGGDTASDCLRTGVRMDTDQMLCVYRRTENEMPGSKKDRELAKEEGAEYQFLTQPVQFIAGDDGRLAAIECIQNRLGEPDEKGRRRPVAIEGTNFIIETEMAVLAIGYWPDQTIAKTTPGLDIKRWGEIIVDPETGATTKPGVYAGGDAVTGPDLVVTAMAAGRKAAHSIDVFLKGKDA
ncbi:MAG: FAD-dependent oxidoreductase, partial [Anaerolineaceae bacterium]|nr:FAD-dependent oxidoreductase [Anaerolineaceae bacterium]